MSLVPKEVTVFRGSYEEASISSRANFVTISVPHPEFGTTDIGSYYELRSGTPVACSLTKRKADRTDVSTCLRQEPVQFSIGVD